MVMHRRACKCTLALLLMFFEIPLLGQGQVLGKEELRTKIEQRYTVLPIQNGIVLSPKSKNGVVSIEISGNTVAVNGAEVTGGELRTRLGADADLILDLSYLAPAERQTLFKVDGNPNPSQITPPPARREPRPRRGRRKDDMIRVFGNVKIDRDEVLNGDVVVVGGNAEIDGQVNGDSVVIGGNLRLGPEANITGDAVVVGGTLSRDPGATVGGDVNEVGVGSGPRFAEILRNRGIFWAGMLPFFGAARTFVRIGVLILFACIVMLAGGQLAMRIGDRAVAEPVRAGLIGLAAELLFLPALIMTVVLLVITILGIPLLLLVPFAVLALIVVFLIGFTGVAARVGRFMGARFGWTTTGPYLTTILGIGALVLPLVLARLVGLFGMNFIAFPLLVAGVLIEYLAWTVGFGAAALTYFKPPTAPNLQPPAGTGPPPEGAHA